MRNLFNFIIRNSSWLLAILLIAFSFYLVFTQNAYQRSVYLSSANRVSGELYSLSNKAISIVHMQKNNENLLAQNAKLQNALQALRSYVGGLSLDTLKTDAFESDSLKPSQFEFIPANVTNMSFSGANNFITLDKGTLDGVKADMGVISQTGVVGVVFNTSDHFSVVIPIVNPKFRLSAKIKNSDNSGSLGWNGKDLHIAQLEELPRHEKFNKGDTVLTSFSRIFPKDLIIGFVEEPTRSRDDNFSTFNLRLATDFYSIQQVLVINDKYHDEQNALEESVNQ